MKQIVGVLISSLGCFLAVSPVSSPDGCKSMSTALGSKPERFTTSSSASEGEVSVLLLEDRTVSGEFSVPGGGVIDGDVFRPPRSEGIAESGAMPMAACVLPSPAKRDDALASPTRAAQAVAVGSLFRARRVLGFDVVIEQISYLEPSYVKVADRRIVPIRADYLKNVKIVIGPSEDLVDAFMYWLSRALREEIAKYFNNMYAHAKSCASAVVVHTRRYHLLPPAMFMNRYMNARLIPLIDPEVNTIPLVHRMNVSGLLYVYDEAAGTREPVCFTREAVERYIAGKSGFVTMVLMPIIEFPADPAYGIALQVLDAEVNA